MAYLGLSPEPSQTEQCLYFCEWQAARNAARARGDAILTMEIVDRPPGCTCPDESAAPVVVSDEETIKRSYIKQDYPMTPQEIERYVKSSQGASGSGYWVVVAAIAALLLMNR